VIVLSLAEFAAKRRKAQDDAIEVLLPLAEAWLNTPNPDTRQALVNAAVRVYTQTYASEGGTRTPLPGPYRMQVRTTLLRSSPDTSPTTLATLLAVTASNAATVQAASDDVEPLLLEWITMHDDKVRHTHQDVAGDQRPPGERFSVGGERLLYPGQPVGDPAIWINCRCTLAPVLASEASSLSEPRPVEGVAMTQTPTAPATEMPADISTTVPWHGVLAPEGKWSGDGRRFAENALTTRDMPLPLTWQKASSEGHGGSVVVARIDKVERVDGEMRATGEFLASAEADEVVGMIAEFGRFGVSVDADDAEFEFDEESGKVTFTSARIASASIVSIPAFAEAWVSLGGSPTGFLPSDEADQPDCDPTDPDGECYDPKAVKEAAAEGSEFGRGPGWLTNPEDTKRLHDYWTVPGEEGYAKIGWGTAGDFNRCRLEVGEEIAENSPDKTQYLNQICAQWHHDALGFWPGRAPTEQRLGTPAPSLSLVAAGGPAAPATWFNDPGLNGVTHLTVTNEGRVFGHIAEWSACHIAYEGVCVSAPHSATDYAYYATGGVLLDDGTMARTGPISLGAGHADHRLGVRGAIEHYDSTSTAVADVSVGEDEHGIWCAGWIRPGTTEGAGRRATRLRRVRRLARGGAGPDGKWWRPWR
jgi:hypothetical protein